MLNNIKKFMVYVLILFFVSCTILTVKYLSELKTLNENLVKINQTMQEQNKIFNATPEGMEDPNEVR